MGFMGRRTLAVSAMAAGFISILGVSAIMSVFCLRAEAAEEHAAQRFDEVRELASFVMFDFYDEAAKLEGATPSPTGRMTTSMRLSQRRPLPP